ncbi:MAG: preprotein translocase subunit SecE [Alphaproteobacteria bacterium]|jgi:preprotein translocase subunit SecE
MARKSGKTPQAIRERAAKTAAVMASPSGAAAGDARKGPGLIQNLRNAPKFFREVRAEARKITWTSRNETWITSVMVAIMVVMAALFFWVVNTILQFAITWLLRVTTGG